MMGYAHDLSSLISIHPWMCRKKENIRQTHFPVLTILVSPTIPVTVSLQESCSFLLQEDFPFSGAHIKKF